MGKDKIVYANNTSNHVTLDNTNLNLQATQLLVKDNIGATNEIVAPTDTSTSGLNGLFKRLLQRITTLIAFFKLGQGTMAQSLAVTIASDQSPLPITLSSAGTTPTITSVTAVAALSSGSQSLIAANTSRKKLIIDNNTNRTIYLLVGGGVANSTTSFSKQIPNTSSLTLNASTDADTTFAFTYSIQQATSTGTVLVTSIT